GTVKVHKPALRALRQFLPPEEGGTDKNQVKNRFLFTLPPYQLLLPALVRDQPGPAGQVAGTGSPEAAARALLDKLPGRVGQVVLSNFAEPFVQFYVGPGLPRDLVLRGRYNEASPDLVTIRLQLRDLQEVYNKRDADVDEKLAAWTKEAHATEAEL